MNVGDRIRWEGVEYELRRVLVSNPHWRWYTFWRPRRCWHYQLFPVAS